jgi:hypothetical protein
MRSLDQAFAGVSLFAHLNCFIGTEIEYLKLNT